MPKLSDQISRSHRGAPLRQVAALPWREGVDGAEVLLVSGGAGRGLEIPKGWPKRNRTNAQAAAIEAVDEVGAVGEISAKSIGKLFYWKELATGRVRVEAEVYALHVARLQARWKAKGDLERVWVPVRKAADMGLDPELAALIRQL